MAGKKMFIRSNKAQIDCLWKYMSQNPNFLNGNNRSPANAARHAKMWAELKAALDLLGPSRSVVQWKVCWRDQKRKHRMETTALKAMTRHANDREVVKLLTHRQSPMEIIQTETVDIKPDVSHEDLEEISPSSPPPEVLSPPPAASPPPSCEPRSTHSRPLRPLRPRPRPSTHTHHDQFSNTHKQLNGLIKSLIKEVRRSNDLKEEQNNILRVISKKFGEHIH